MKKKEKKNIQITLLMIGSMLIIITYFYYPSLNQQKLLVDQTIEKGTEGKEDPNIDKSNTFENLEYVGMYDLNKPFTVKSKKAHILTEEPNIVYMKYMNVTLNLTDGRVVNITSEEGKYNKTTFDCFFEKNVKATDGDTIILAENLDLLATENSIIVYNEVKLDYVTGFLQADKVDYDFETKKFKVSMFDNSPVKMKIIK